ncbi:hypothetical protein JKP88DRAFT_242039 [Tribonema minus]|uniref:Uncharacterized protein n=1 Tax=Tribonema minus TaxID=303371 RepID=A0A836CA26_9STRA|nr:hypothetical protein JKP88DRAFT_242039 [Tribonema minus]
MAEQEQPRPQSQRGWNYLDFDSRWPEVYRIFQSAHVQEVLRPSMEEWCSEMVHRGPWTPGSSLWLLSRTDFFCRIDEQADALIEEQQLFQRYKEMRKRARVPVPDDENIESDAYMAVHNEIWATLCPKEGQAMAETAALLLPGEIVATVEGAHGDVVLLPRRREIFDFSRYGMWKLDRCAADDSLSPNSVIADVPAPLLDALLGDALEAPEH